MSYLFTAKRVFAKDGNLRYTVETDPVEFIAGTKRNLNLMWDTGAFISVLSVSNFIKNTDSEDYQRLIKSIDDDKEFIDYNSVSGSGKGVLRKIKNISIGNQYLKEFYFLLVKDVRRIKERKEYAASVSLLGADFIDFCKNRHDIGNDIFVDEFDDNGYSDFHNTYNYKGNVMRYSDLFNIIPEIGET